MRAADRLTLAIFVVVVVFAGLNAVAVRYSNHELAPFWGAGLRFAIAALILFAVAAARRASMPRGRALIGALLYGALGFAVSLGLVYWGLVSAPAGAAAVAISLVPVVTLILAPLHGLERFRPQAIVGALISVAGIAFIFAEQLGANVAPLSLLALLLAPVAMAESTIVAKQFPRSDPAITNAVGMGFAAVLLVAVALIAGEPLALPQQPQTLLAFAYLIVAGSVLLFMGFLYILARWDASSVSYQLLFMPLVTVPAAAYLRGEPVSWVFVAGGALVFAGVWFGALAPRIGLPGTRAAVAPLSPAAQPAIAGEGSSAFVPPSCP